MALKKTIHAGLLGCFLACPTQVFSDGLAGAYLSGNLANAQNDYAAAARYFSQALIDDPDNVYLMQSALLAMVAKGDVGDAAVLAEKIAELGENSHLSDLVLLADSIKRSDFNAAARLLSREDHDFTELLSGLMSGWVELGLGKMASASDVFDALQEPEVVRLFGQYHKALALAVVGDFGGADKLLEGDERGNLRLNRGSLIAHAQILSQLDRNPEAVEMLNDSLNGTIDLQLTQLRDQLQNNEPVEYNFITSAQEGAAEVFFTLASALNDDDNEYSSLLYTRLAQYLRPQNTGAILLAAEILRDQGQFELATEIYSEVEASDPLFLDAELGRADTLLDADKPEAAIEVLRNLSRSHSDIPRVFMSLGDALRSTSDFAQSRKAYEKALAMIPNPQRNHWFLLYAMGICSEQLKDWDRAEREFRQALELSPGQPLVLNYLGYSLVEQRMKLDEALAMIKEAVAARPDSGFITDSLGWVLYRLEKYEEAVEPMELAIELIPDDPVINDHLGDVYWKVDRKREAEFQWKRALSFDPEPEDATRIRRKLEVGLDVVLESEDAQKATTGNGN
ncbi:hypothetical protein GCM10008927_22790 [Amylibacter ulvae]|uniref:Uncharacterized protein n=1 Tax=Paramylibacter ulvae TaxID=1651968 RepID=A0ABQ3D8P2_9RHOB|nr:tetratricopeptide repeat protein [Amylibacter ulvae]GHA56468.1 hypothetical protein GCM10008927_22790 [Amylibacter ulvae]